MKIHINSRRVDAYRLEIISGDKCIYNDYRFSNPKDVIEIEVGCTQTLKFNCYFDLSRDEKNHMLDRCDCPEWEYYSYDNKDLFDSAGVDYITDGDCPLPAKNLYATIVSNIPIDASEMHLMFRRSKINDDMPLLYVMKRQEREIINVHYERTSEYQGYIRKMKKINMRRHCIGASIVFLLLLIAFWFEINNPKWYYINPPIVIAIVIVHFRFNIWRNNRNFIKKVNSTPRFREVKGKIETF